VDRYFFTEVNEGGISALNYSMILYVLPVSMISIALATVIFPKFSANIQNKKFDELNKNVIDAIRANLFIFVPVTFFFLLYGNDLIRLLFERGKFTAQDSQIAFNVLKYYAVSLIFYSAYSIYNKIIYSTSLIYALLMITLGGIIIKIILNFLLVHSYQQNGLAFSTSVSYIFLFLLSMLLIYHKIPGIKQSVFFKELVFYLFNGIICFFIVEILFSGILRIYILQDLFKMVIFYAFFLLNLKLANHGSIQLAGSIIRNLRDVRSI
jgi:putative peptidoglycan lipid II flippase